MPSPVGFDAPVGFDDPNITFDGIDLAPPILPSGRIRRGLGLGLGLGLAMKTYFQSELTEE